MIRLQYLVVLGCVAVLFIAPVSLGQEEIPTFELTGTLRDFSDSHPDFENRGNGRYPLVTGMVTQDIGPDDKPVLNASGGGSLTLGKNRNSNALVTVTFNGTAIYVESSKDLSNVVLKLSDGTEYKYDNLDQTNIGKAGTFDIPDVYAGTSIVGCWIKSGSYQSGDGPGYGRWFDAADALSEIPVQWRIESEESFSQWYTNTEGVNQSTKHTIVLEDPDGDGVYRFENSIHNGESFFPLDDLLYGNQNRNHNFHFTYEVHSKFTYTDPSTRDYDLIFEFSGDDDVWVYINGKLVIDLGGVHPEKYGSVNVDTVAGELGLEPGETYDFDFFFAERHTTQSNFLVETSIQFLSPLYD